MAEPVEAAHHAANSAHHAATKGLDKKLGPLPKKAWIGIVIAGVIAGLYLRSRSASTASTATDGTDTTAAQEAAQAAQEGASGGSDPGTPTTSSASTDTGIDPATGYTYASELAAATQTLNDAAANVQAPTDNGPPVINIQAPGITAQAKAQVLPKLSPGGVRAPSGHSAPAAPPGYTAKGLGSGNWEFVPVVETMAKKENPPAAPKASVHRPTVTARAPVTSKPAPKPAPKKETATKKK